MSAANDNPLPACISPQVVFKTLGEGLDGAAAYAWDQLLASMLASPPSPRRAKEYVSTQIDRILNGREALRQRALAAFREAGMKVSDDEGQFPDLNFIFAGRPPGKPGDPRP